MGYLVPVSGGAGGEVTVNVDALKKGDVIPCDVLERILGVSRSETKYSLGVLALKTHLSEELRKRGLFCVIVQEDYNLEICTDSKATQVNAKRVEEIKTRMLRVQEDISSVEEANIEDEELLKLHRRTAMVHGRRLQAVLEADRQLPDPTKK